MRALQMRARVFPSRDSSVSVLRCEVVSRDPVCTSMHMCNREKGKGKPKGSKTGEDVRIGSAHLHYPLLRHRRAPSPRLPPPHPSNNRALYKQPGHGQRKEGKGRRAPPPVRAANSTDGGGEGPSEHKAGARRKKKRKKLTSHFSSLPTALPRLAPGSAREGLLHCFRKWPAIRATALGPAAARAAFASPM